jgi:hypothetical protein
VVCLGVADLTEPERRQEGLKLRRRGHKLTALLRLVLALLRTSGFRLTGARLPDGRAKMRILRAWIGPASTSRCERSCGSCVYHPVGSTPGAGGSARVRSTISPPVPHLAVSTDVPRGAGDRGDGHLARLSSRPDR